MHQQVRAGDKERIQLLYLLKSGHAESVSHAAEILGRGRVTLQRWLAKYEENGIDGLLYRQPRVGRLCQIPQTAQQQLVERLKSSEGFESYGEIQQWLEQQYNHQISYKGIHKHVRYRLNAKPKRPRPVSTQQDPKQVFF